MTDVPAIPPAGDAATPSGLSRKSFLRRSIASAAVVAGGGSLLAACGDDDDPKPSGGGSTDKAAATAAAQLTMLNWHTATPKVGLGRGFIAAGKDYEARVPKQTVSFQAKPFASYVAAGTTACRAGKLASNLILLPALNHSKLFPCVKHVDDAGAGELLDELSGWANAAVTPGESGEYAGYPVGGQGIVLYYNKALFEKAGLDPEATPTTYDEFADICEKLKGAGIDPLGISGTDSYTPWWLFGAFLTQNTPTQDDIDAFIRGETSFDNPGTVAALEAVADTYKRGWWPAGFKDKTFADVEADFIAGKVAMVPGIVTDIMSWAVWDAKMKDPYGAFAAPLIEGVKASSPTVFFNIAIIASVAADADNVDAADNFARYLASQEGQALLLKEAGAFPNRRDVDVATITGSDGAARIQAILEENPMSDSMLTWLNSTAVGAALPKVTSTVTGGNVQQFVSSIQKLQEQGA